MSAGRWRVGLLFAVMAASFAAMTGTAGAHGPEATFTPITTEPVANDLAANLRVTLIYDNDAEPVDDATVLVTPVGPGGTEDAQIGLLRAPEPGTYEGSVPVGAPGEWTFKVTSEDPEAALDIVIAIPEPASASTVVAPTEAPTTSAATKESAVPSSVPDGSSTTAAEAAIVSDDAPPADDADEGSFPWGIAVLVAVVAAGVAMAMAYALRPNKDGSGDDGPAEPTEDTSVDGSPPPGDAPGGPAA